MTLLNVGLVPASGRLQLAAEPGQAAKIRGKQSFAFKNLAPGAKHAETIEVRITGHDETVTVESVPHSPCLVPAMIHLQPKA